MSKSNLDTFAVSIFDTLESKPHFVSVQSSSADPADILVVAYNVILQDDLEVPLTRDDVEASPEMFADMVTVSIIKTQEKNLYERPSIPYGLDDG
jgi:hypothetical protein